MAQGRLPLPVGIRLPETLELVLVGEPGVDELLVLREPSVQAARGDASQSASPCALRARRTRPSVAKTRPSQSRNEPGSGRVIFRCRVASANPQCPLDARPVEPADNSKPRQTPRECLKDHASCARIQIDEHCCETSHFGACARITMQDRRFSLEMQLVRERRRCAWAALS